MCRWLRTAMWGMPSMSTEMNAFMQMSLGIHLAGGELGIFDVEGKSYTHGRIGFDV